MESATDKEIKYHIRRHIALPYKIKRLETERLESQLYAYSMQSFTGTSQYGFSIDDYTHAINIEQFVIRLVLNQESLDRQINALKLRYKLFQELLPTLDYPTLKTLLKHEHLSDYEVMVYNEIQEINYYIEQHRVTERRLKSDDQVADLTAVEMENILNGEETETTKMLKVSILNNIEDELMAMLE